MFPRDHALSDSTPQYITLQYSTVHCRTAQYITINYTSLLGGLNAEKQLKIAIFSKINLLCGLDAEKQLIFLLPFSQKSKMANN